VDAAIETIAGGCWFRIPARSAPGNYLEDSFEVRPDIVFDSCYALHTTIMISWPSKPLMSTPASRTGTSPVSRPPSLIAHCKTGPLNVLLKYQSSPPACHPGETISQMKPAASFRVEQRPAPPVYRPSAAPVHSLLGGIQLHPVKVPIVKPVFPVVQLAVAAVQAPDARVLRIRGEIAAAQAIVENHRATIDGYSNGTHIRAGVLRRGQLQALIAALNATIPARRDVVAGHQSLNEADPGNHQGAIAVEEQKLNEAQAELAALQQIAATAWAPVAGVAGREFRIAARWDRDPQVREERDIDPGGGAPFQVVGRGRRGRPR
jgi:hypothetical protein